MGMPAVDAHEQLEVVCKEVVGCVHLWNDAEVSDAAQHPQQALVLLSHQLLHVVVPRVVKRQLPLAHGVGHAREGAGLWAPPGPGCHHRLDADQLAGVGWGRVTTKQRQRRFPVQAQCS